MILAGDDAAVADQVAAAFDPGVFNTAGDRQVISPDAETGHDRTVDHYIPGAVDVAGAEIDVTADSQKIVDRYFPICKNRKTIPATADHKLRPIFTQLYRGGKDVFRFFNYQIRCGGRGRVHGFEVSQRLTALDWHCLMRPMVVNPGFGIRPLGRFFTCVTAKVKNNTKTHKGLDFFIVYYMLKRFRLRKTGAVRLQSQLLSIPYFRDFIHKFFPLSRFFMKNISAVISGHKTLREKIVEVLRETIIRQKIRPGERITELEVAEHFGVSRTPIREAFRQLESEGFLTIIPRKGAIVSDIKEQDFRDFYEIKGVLEGYAARRAVSRMTEKDIERLELLNEEIKRCAQRQDVSGMTRAHNAFHNLILESCGNQKIQQVVAGLVRQFLRFRFYVASLVHVEAILRGHSEIVAAIKERDAEKAEACMVKNAQLGLEVLLKEFASGNQEEQ